MGPQEKEFEKNWQQLDLTFTGLDNLMGKQLTVLNSRI